MATADFYAPDETGAVRQLPSRLFDCRRCDLVIRDLCYDDPRVSGHYDVAQYTSRGAVELFHRQRIRWFRWFADRTIRYCGRDRGRLLDFGCSYGHLMDCFVERGWEVKGVEISFSALKCLMELRPQYEVVSGVRDVAPGWPDAVTAIDSLYCVERPDRTMAEINDVLRPGGAFAGRVTKRNFHYRLNSWWQRGRLPAGGVPRFSYSFAGDAKTGFSRSSLETMLGRAGFRNPVFARREPGKRRSPGSAVVQHTLWAVEALTLGLLPTATGLQFWCKKPE